MSPAMRDAVSALVASFTVGAGRLPNTDPRPGGEGDDVRAAGDHAGGRHRVVAGSVHEDEALASEPVRRTRRRRPSGLRPPLATAPSDFSRIVVMPPSLLPGEGLSSIEAPWSRGVALPPGGSAPSAARPPRGRRRGCGEQVLGAVDLRCLASIAGAAEATSKSAATPSAGFAVMPDQPSEPPHCSPAPGSRPRPVAPGARASARSSRTCSEPRRHGVDRCRPRSWMVHGRHGHVARQAHSDQASDLR